MNKKLTKAFTVGITSALIFSTSTVFAADVTENKANSLNTTIKTDITNSVQKENNKNSLSTLATEKVGAGIALSLSNFYDKEENAKTEIVKLLNPEEKKDKTPSYIDERNEYFNNLAIAQVDNYVNVRTKNSKDSKAVGKIYGNCQATILKEKKGWYQIKSGSVKGWVKKDYFITGKDAETFATKNGYILATVNTECLNLRKDKSTESEKVAQLAQDTSYSVKSYNKSWVRLTVDDGTWGYVAAPYVNITTNMETAKTLKQEAEEIKKAKQVAKALEAQRESEEAAKEVVTKQDVEDYTEQQTTKEIYEQVTTKAYVSPTTKAYEQATTEAYTEQVTERETEQTTEKQTTEQTNASGQAAVDYAMQFLGNPYVYGGSSLTNGTDCSGFTMSVYARFGVSLPRTSYSQRSAGYAVSFSSLQPGDLICYEGHVALYIGGGQIIHASTPSTGIIITSMYYGSSPICARRVI